METGKVMALCSYSVMLYLFNFLRKYSINAALVYPILEPTLTLPCGPFRKASSLLSVFADINPPVAFEASKRETTGGSSRSMAEKNLSMSVP